MLKKIKAIVFDNDGVLVDSEIIYAKAYQDVFKSLDKQVSLEEVLDLVCGKSKVESTRNLKNKYGIEPNSDFISQKNKIANYEIENNLQVCKDVLDLLSQLNLKQAVASNASREEIELKHKVSGLDRYFSKDIIFSGEEVLNAKPAPDVYLAAAAGIGERPEGCIAVEDSASGVQAGKAAGMYTVGCLGGSHIFDKQEHRQKLLDAGADVVIDDMSQLKAIIEELM